jgi:xanthine/uracil permease
MVSKEDKAFFVGVGIATILSLVLYFVFKYGLLASVFIGILFGILIGLIINKLQGE